VDVVNSVASFLQSQLGNALLYLLIVAVADLVFGILVAGILNKDFTLRKLGDFTVTTLGFQKTLAFIGVLLLMFVRGDKFTEGAVATVALFYATSILPDLYDKISTLFFKGKLPLSVNLRAPKPAVA
jgi:hypothetical protein